MASRRNRNTTETQVDLFDPKAFSLDLDPELAKLIQPALDRQQRAVGQVGGWPFLSTQGGIFSRGDVQLESFECFVLAHARMNTYFAGVFNPSRRDSPDCWAIQGMEQEEHELAPPEDLPGKQHAKCFGCPQNEFGSDLRGRGKACKNIHLLALLVVGEGETPEPAELARMSGMRLRVPPTSHKWAEVVKKLSERSLPLPFVRMRFEIVEDEKTQFQVVPVPLLPPVRDHKLQRALWARVDEAEAQIRQQPPARAALPAGGAQQARIPARAGKAVTVRRRSAK